MLNMATIRRRRLMSSATGIDYSVGGNDPAVVADFVNEYYRVGGSATTFASMFTFSRTGTATYFDSNGILQTAADGVARVGNHVYNGTSWVNKGILIETEARTNIALYSNDFSNVAWTKNNILSTTQNATGIDGSTSAWTIVPSTGSAGHQFLQALTLSAATTYTFSIYAKASGYNFIYVFAYGTGAGQYQVFNLSTGALGTTTNGTFVARSIEDVGNGIYRCSISITTGGTTGSNGIEIGIQDADNVNAFAGDGTSGVIFYGAQVEAGSTPSSYIPTAGTAVTRNADSLVIAAANMSASTSAMSLQLDGTITYADEGAAAQQTFLRWQTDANNYISLDLDTDSTATGEVNANQAVGGTVDTVVAGAEYTAGVNVAFNIASRHTSGAINVAKDGTAATADTTPASLVDLSARDCELFQDAMGNISQFRQWAVDLGDTGIASASS